MRRALIGLGREFPQVRENQESKSSKMARITGAPITTVCLHKPLECKLKQEGQPFPNKKPGSGKPKKKQDKYNLKMRAYQTLFESSSEEEVGEEQEPSDGNETEGSNTSE